MNPLGWVVHLLKQMMSLSGGLPHSRWSDWLIMFIDVDFFKKVIAPKKRVCLIDRGVWAGSKDEHVPLYLKKNYFSFLKFFFFFLNWMASIWKPKIVNIGIMGTKWPFLLLPSSLSSPLTMIPIFPVNLLIFPPLSDALLHLWWTLVDI